MCSFLVLFVAPATRARNSGLPMAKAGHILEMASKNKFELPSENKNGR
jgi:hypothetical protein